MAMGLAAALAANTGCFINIDDDANAFSRVNTVVETRTVALPHIANTPLDIRTENGAVKVTKGEVDGVVVIAKLRARSMERLEKMHVKAERIEDGALRVRVEWPEGGRKGSEGCSFDIQTPGALTTSIHSSNGEITLEDLSGGAILWTSNAAICVRRHNGFVTAESSNGDIALRGVGGAKADTSNGHILIALAADAAGPVNADTSNGSITLEVGPGFRGEVGADSSNGRVQNHVKRALAVGKPERARGVWQLGEAADREKSVLRSSNGPITIEEGSAK